MTKDEALKLALEGAANYIDALGGDSKKYRQTLEQPEQKPVYKYCDDGKVIFTNPEILSRRPNKENV